MSSRRRGRRPALRCNLEVLTGALDWRVRHYASVQPRRERASFGLSRRVPGGWVEPLGGSHEHHAASHISPRSLVPLRSGLAGNRRQPRRYGRFAALALTPPRNRRVTGRRKTRHRDRRQLHYLAAGFGRHSGLVIRGCVVAGCREPPFAG